MSSVNDIRFALRMAARNPGSTALIVALLALGIGATTTIFSLFDAVLLRPLPVRHPEALVRIVQELPRLGTRSSFPFAYYEALRGHATTVVTFGETGHDMHFRMTEPEPAEQITVHAVTPDFFESLGVRPLLGRVLMPDDEARNAGTPPAVLSYAFWRRRFRGDPGVVRGETLELNGHRFAIVGVLARDFNGLSVDTAPDVRIPDRAFPLIGDSKLESAFFELAGRLKPGVSRLQAQAECLAIWRATMPDYYRSVENEPPEGVAALLRRGMKLESLKRGTSILRNSFGNVFKLLMASVSLLVLIVGLNVAGLLVARAAARQQEMAVRLAIGGTPLRLARQMVIEGLLLAVFGAVSGLLITTIATPLALHMLPPLRELSTAIVPLSIDVGVNRRILLFLVALSIVITLIFTVSPVLTALRLGIDNVLRTARSSRSLRGREALIILQIALCTFLLVSADLLVRSFQRLRETPSGFSRDSVATFTCDFEGYKQASGILTLLENRIQEIPGVLSVATSSIGVMRGHGMFASVVPEGKRVGKADFMDSADNAVSLDYFRTMSMRILAGRDFVPADIPQPKQTTPVNAVVNENFAHRFFASVDPLGKRFGWAVEGSIAKGKFQIVGVVSDAKYRSLKEPIRPMFFTLQPDFDSFVLNVRTRIRPEQILEPVRKTAASVAPGLPFLEVNTLAHEVEESTAPEEITAVLASLFGVTAMLLAGIGTYGLLAYAVTQRRRELGIRMALGAQPANVASLVARQTSVMAASGIVLGVAAALAASTAMRALLYEISAHDPKSFLTAAGFVALIAALATVAPVMDAIRVQPAETLRLEN